MWARGARCYCIILHSCAYVTCAVAYMHLVKNIRVAWRTCNTHTYSHTQISLSCWAESWHEETKNLGKMNFSFRFEWNCFRRRRPRRRAQRQREREMVTITEKAIKVQRRQFVVPIRIRSARFLPFPLRFPFCRWIRSANLVPHVCCHKTGVFQLFPKSVHCWSSSMSHLTMIWCIWRDIRLISRRKFSFTLKWSTLVRRLSANAMGNRKNEKTKYKFIVSSWSWTIYWFSTNIRIYADNIRKSLNLNDK